MSPDFRALCAELLVLAEESISYRARVSEAIKLVDRARAELAKPADAPAAPPAEGEVAKLVADLRRAIDDVAAMGWLYNALIIKRAAELLERHAAPVPVPVAERLPGPEDCDAEGKCWLHGKVEGDWRLINPAKSGVPHLRYCFSHWLPASDLPLPAPQGGEVES